jgi:hypothetical protein
MSTTRTLRPASAARLAVHARRRIRRFGATSRRISSRQFRTLYPRGSHQRAAWAFWLPVFLLAATHARANERPDANAMAIRLQAIVDALKSELAIPQEVTLEVVAENPLMASVEPAKEGDGFVIAIEGAFASRLTDAELKGVLAHELGHVWIFTHHPYLQTEQLANRIAMRAVSRENLEQVYEKVWKNGAKGDLGRFLGLSASTSASAAIAAPAATPAGVSKEPAPASAPVVKEVAVKEKETDGGAIRN